jgi:hypothetical protein
LARPVEQSATGIINIFSLSNTRIQIRHLQKSTWYWTLILPLGSYRGYVTFRQERKTDYSLQKICIYSETIRNEEPNEESTTGSNQIYDVVIEH